MTQSMEEKRAKTVSENTGYLVFYDGSSIESVGSPFDYCNVVVRFIFNSEFFKKTPQNMLDIGLKIAFTNSSFRCDFDFVSGIFNQSRVNI